MVLNLVGASNISTMPRWRIREFDVYITLNPYGALTIQCILHSNTNIYKTSLCFTSEHIKQRCSRGQQSHASTGYTDNHNIHIGVSWNKHNTRSSKNSGNYLFGHILNIQSAHHIHISWVTRDHSVLNYGYWHRLVR